MQILITKALVAGFAASMAIGGSTTTQMPNATASPSTIYSDNGIVTVAFSSKDGKDRSPLDSWLKKLVYLESNGVSDIKILDHNGLHSFGCLQFQLYTFQAYGARYGLLSPGDDIEKLIYDCNLQKEIARRMINENPENWRNWYTSVTVKGLGLPPKEKVMPQFSMK